MAAGSIPASSDAEASEPLGGLNACAYARGKPNGTEVGFLRHNLVFGVPLLGGKWQRSGLRYSPPIYPAFGLSFCNVWVYENTNKGTENEVHKEGYSRG